MRESHDLEFKQVVNNTFLKTVSAFANYDGGRVLFGIDDDGVELGLEDANAACLQIESKINDSIKPTPDFALKLNARANVVELTVRTGLHKPYLYQGKAYRRSDSSTVEVDSVELRRLVLEGENLSYDALPSGKQSLSFSYLGDWLHRVAGISEMSGDVLRSLELADANGTYNIAAELLADENDRPGMDIARFGDSISVMLDRETPAGCSILEQYDRAVTVFRRYYIYEEVAGFSRIERERIPETAFREAIANALVHRLWDIDAHIRVAMFDDRVEISSLGGLPQGLTEQNYLNGRISVLRNPIIGSIFLRLNIIERFGTGVPRIRDAYRESATQPLFEVNDDSVFIALPVLADRLPLSEDEERVWLLLVNRSCAISEVMAQTGFGRAKLKAMLKRLAEAGYVEVDGAGRGTRYRATKPGNGSNS